MGLSLLVLATWSQSAHAGIYACPLPSGGTVYQDRPCEDAAKPGRSTAVPDTGSALPTIGLHSSWFERPTHAADRAFCDKRGCECGDIENKFESGIAQAVADSLYIDGNWHRYETGVDNWLNANGTAAESYEMQLEVQAAACEVMMAQEAIKQFADGVLRVLQKRADEAIDAGYDDPSVCDGNNDEACSLNVKLELFRRMLIDIRALELERVSYSMTN